MTVSRSNPKANFFFEKETRWQKEVEVLRSIILACDLQEEVKWGCPCYQYNKKNVVLIHTFKGYCALLFMKGALLKDDEKVLIQQTENVQAARQMRFTSAKEIVKLKSIIRRYVREAIEVEKAGLKVPMKKSSEFKMAAEFKIHLDKSKNLKKVFEALTPGRQRAYLLYFSSAKQKKTRTERVEKYIPQILKGKGIDD